MYINAIKIPDKTEIIATNNKSNLLRPVSEISLGLFLDSSIKFDIGSFSRSITRVFVFFSIKLFASTAFSWERSILIFSSCFSFVFIFTF